MARSMSGSHGGALTAEDYPCDVEIASIDFNGRLEFIEGLLRDAIQVLNVHLLVQVVAIRGPL